MISGASEETELRSPSPKIRENAFPQIPRPSRFRSTYAGSIEIHPSTVGVPAATSSYSMVILSLGLAMN